MKWTKIRRIRSAVFFVKTYWNQKHKQRWANQTQIALGWDLRDPHSMSLHQSRVGVQLLGTLCCILHRSTQIHDDPSGMGWDGQASVSSVSVSSTIETHDAHLRLFVWNSDPFHTDPFQIFQPISIDSPIHIGSTDPQIHRSTSHLHSTAWRLQTFCQATQGPQPGRLQGSTAWPGLDTCV
jgi:hypothetical protein